MKINRRAFIRSFIYSTIALSGSIACAESSNLEIINSYVPVKGLHPSLEGLSIGVMTDFHAGGLGNRRVILRAISKMKDLRPDLIVLTGDYVDGTKNHSRDSINEALFLFKEFKSLKAPLGVYSVLGNHDHWADSTRITRLIEADEIPVLKNENIFLQNGLILAGVDDYLEGRRNTAKALAGTSEKDIVILLSHNPDINYELASDNRVNLVISGHTHGGQIRMPFTGWTPWVPCSPRYKGKTGLILETGRRYSFISKGIGTSLLPMRISCPPDIALLKLKMV